MPDVAASEERDGRNARWDEHREQRRRLIVDAARAVVEDAPPGAELRLADVADRAGLVRTVVQRHFGGRTALLRAVQADVAEQAFGLAMVEIGETTTLRDLATEIVTIVLAWVDEHPSLHALIEGELGDGRPSELNRAIATYAGWLEALFAGISEARGVVLDEARRAEVELMVVGIIGQVRAVVTQWVGAEPRRLSRERVVETLSTALVLQLADRATAYGVPLDPDVPLLAAL